MSANAGNRLNILRPKGGYWRYVRIAANQGDKSRAHHSQTG